MANPGARSSGENVRTFQRWLRSELKSRGFVRIRTKDLWRRGSRDDGWLLLDRQTSKHHFGGARSFTMNVGIWPLGTYENEVRVRSAQSRPGMPDEPEYLDAPMRFRPRDFGDAQADWVVGGLFRADAVPMGDWWEIDDGDGFDLGPLQSKVGRFLDAVDDVSQRLLLPEHAITWLLHRHEEVASLRSTVWELRYAVAVIEATGAQRDRLRDLVSTLSAAWKADPRPREFGAELHRLRTLAGLEE